MRKGLDGGGKKESNDENTTLAHHSQEQSRNFGMSSDIAWYPNDGHLMTGIFQMILVNFKCFKLMVLSKKGAQKISPLSTPPTHINGIFY